MSLLDKNKIFFGLIHYILSEQKNVDWILKTSLIDFTGISSVLEEKPYKKESLLNDVVDYVVSIKPYHVQFSRYFEHYETASETISIPKNDKLETTIHHRFDAIQTTPDIVKIVQNIYEEPTDTLIDGIYYEEPTDTYYTIKEGKITTDFDKETFINTHKANRLFYLGTHNLDELKKELNANFKGLEISSPSFNIGEFGYELYSYDTNDYDSPTIVYDYCFVNGSEYFKDNQFPNIMIDNSFKYSKIFEESGHHRFKIPSDINTFGRTIKVFRQKHNQEPKEVEDYKIQFNSEYGNYIDIYTGLNTREKLYICICQTKKIDEMIETLYLTNAYVIVGYPFTESNSDILKRKFIYLNEESEYVYLDSPLGDIDTTKLVIHKQTNGRHQEVFRNYQLSNSKVAIHKEFLNEDDHIIMTAFDYKYLYDKIYMWEDLYGRSNNIINLDGDKFLRARYEKDRPSELVVSAPLSSFTTYEIQYQDKESNIITGIDVHHNDYKNDISICNYEANSLIKLQEVTTSNENPNVITKISFDNNPLIPSTPGKILFNSEIIEYKTMDKNGTTTTISNLNRSLNGSVNNFNQLVNISSTDEGKEQNPFLNIILPYIDDYWYAREKDCKYVSYYVTNSLQKEYDCPMGINDNSYVTVSLLNKISLLNDITENTKTIDIDSCNVVSANIQNSLIDDVSSTRRKGSFILKINEDTIPFTTIYKDESNSNIYHIEDFILPSQYKNFGDNVIYSSKDAIIHSCIPTTLDRNKYEVSLVTTSGGWDIIQTELGENYIQDDMKRIVYRQAGNILYDTRNIGDSVGTTEVGVIVNDTIYKNDGSILAKIIDDKFYLVQPIIVLNEGLDKGTVIKIKVESVNPNE